MSDGVAGGAAGREAGGPQGAAGATGADGRAETAVANGTPRVPGAALPDAPAGADPPPDPAELLRGRPASPGGARLLLGAFGDAGHAFPIIALGEALLAAGHEVVIQTWDRWRPQILHAGMGFAAAPEYRVRRRDGAPLKPFEAVLRAARDSDPLFAELRPDAVVADLLTLTPALAGEQHGVPVGTLVPHVDPRGEAGWPPFSIGARLPRTDAGLRAWRLLDPLMRRGLASGAAELDETRRRLGLPAQGRPHGAISHRLALIGTLPQLEYPRPAAIPGRHVVGPFLWEPPAEPVDPPPGEGPLVLVAPSTSQDPEQRLLRAALEGLAAEPVRVLAATNRRGDAAAIAALPHPPNARIVDWVSYAATMPRADVVISHGGHGTLMRAVASGAVPVVVPAVGDMNENAARLAWAGLGVRLPRRLAEPRPVRAAVRLALGRRDVRARIDATRLWLAAGGDGAARSVPLVERHLLA